MYKTLRLNRDMVEQMLLRHAKTAGQIAELVASGALDTNEFIYTMDDAVELMYNAAVGHWANCQCQKNPKSEHSARQGTRLAKRFVKMAFVPKKRK